MIRALGFWEAVRVVAMREFLTRFRERSFWISTGITVAIIAAVIALPSLLGSDEERYDVAFLGVDAAGVQAAALQQAEAADFTLEVKQVGTVAAADAGVRENELDAYVRSTNDGAEVVVDRELDSSLGLVLDTAFRASQGQADLGAQQGLAVRTLDPDAEQSETRGNIAFIGSLLLYGQLIGYGFWVAAGVVEEKSSRVVELLLSSIPSKALLTGKVVGIGALGLLQLLLVACVAAVVATTTGVVSLSSVFLVPTLLVVGFFVLGYTLYACLMAAAAARVSRQEELQNVITPVTTIALVSFFATFYVAQNPETLASRVLSILPPFSALTMPVRAARGDAAPWELPLAVVLLVATIALLVVVAGRVYDGAVLRMGAKVSFGDAWRAGRRRTTTSSPS